jgi:5-methylcytosine-specific restriction endonuclease McrA
VTICKWCKSNGKSPLLKNYQLDDKKIIDLYVNKGMSANRISKVFGLSRRPILRRLRLAGYGKKETSKNKRIKWMKEIPQFRLKEDVWSFKVIDRDGLKCKWCDSTEKLEAHHIIPIRDIENPDLLFDLNNGICLCKKCHGKTIYKEKELEDFFHNLVKKDRF